MAASLTLRACSGSLSRPASTPRECPQPLPYPFMPHPPPLSCSGSPLGPASTPRECATLRPCCLSPGLPHPASPPCPGAPFCHKGDGLSSSPPCPGAPFLPQGDGLSSSPLPRAPFLPQGDGLSSSPPCPRGTVLPQGRQSLFLTPCPGHRSCHKGDGLSSSPLAPGAPCLATRETVYLPHPCPGAPFLPRGGRSIFLTPCPRGTVLATRETVYLPHPLAVSAASLARASPLLVLLGMVQVPLEGLPLPQNTRHPPRNSTARAALVSQARNPLTPLHRPAPALPAHPSRVCCSPFRREGRMRDERRGEERRERRGVVCMCCVEGYWHLPSVSAPCLSLFLDSGAGRGRPSPHAHAAAASWCCTAGDACCRQGSWPPLTGRSSSSSRGQGAGPTAVEPASLRASGRGSPSAPRRASQGEVRGAP